MAESSILQEMQDLAADPGADQYCGVVDGRHHEILHFRQHGPLDRYFAVVRSG